MALSADELRLALDVVARREADAPSVCPRCGAKDLQINDHSARPHAEWYHLSCAACGLDEMMHIPLGPPTMGDLD